MRKFKLKKGTSKLINLQATISYFLLLLFLISFAACPVVDAVIDPDPITDPEPETPNNSIIDQFTTSSDYEVLELDGYKLEILPGSIPALANGSEATVTFSIETGLDLPKPLPVGITQVGDAVHFGPEGFVFQLPLLIKFPLPNSYSPDQVSIVHFDDEDNKWRMMPMAFFDQENNTIGAYVFDLDLYTLVNIEGFDKSNESRLKGGIRWNIASSVHGDQNQNFLQYPPHPPEWNPITTYVILQVEKFIPKFELDYSLLGNTDDWVAVTATSLTGSVNQSSPFHSVGIEWFLPQGEYEFCVQAMSEKYFPGDLTRRQTQTYNMLATAVIDEPVICNGWHSLGVDQACAGWTVPKVPAEGSWSNSEICPWPEHTVPVCTGEFQATLTWQNHENESADLDLYLYGPDDLIVYYEIEQVGDILLDRDIREYSMGHAQENICAPLLDEMPPGNYRIAVQHYTGAEKDFQVRLVRGEKSESYSGTISSNTTPVADHNSKPEITVFEFTVN